MRYRISGLFEVRQRYGLTQKEFAQLAGISPTTVQAIESQRSGVQEAVVRKVVKVIARLLEPELVADAEGDKVTPWDVKWFLEYDWRWDIGFAVQAWGDTSSTDWRSAPRAVPRPDPILDLERRADERRRRRLLEGRLSRR